MHSFVDMMRLENQTRFLEGKSNRYVFFTGVVTGILVVAAVFFLAPGGITGKLTESGTQSAVGEDVEIIFSDTFGWCNGNGGAKVEKPTADPDKVNNQVSWSYQHIDDTFNCEQSQGRWSAVAHDEGNDGAELRLNLDNVDLPNAGPGWTYQVTVRYRIPLSFSQGVPDQADHVFFLSVHSPGGLLEWPADRVVCSTQSPGPTEEFVTTRCRAPFSAVSDKMEVRHLFGAQEFRDWPTDECTDVYPEGVCNSVDTLAITSIRVTLLPPYG